MRKKREFLMYTGMWVLAVFILIALLMQNIGDARIINYSGIIRGATQKLVKEELSGEKDDELIERIDGILYDLQTGKGNYRLNRSPDTHYQNRLSEMKVLWETIKEEVYRFRQGNISGKKLYDLSQQHFEMADQMVLCAEEVSNTKMIRSIVCYFICLILTVFAFMILDKRGRAELEKSIYTDNLTGILNRAGFEEKAFELLRLQSKEAYTLVEIDIDDFKFINNIYGFAFGDSLLRFLAEALAKRYCGEETCARIDADDFVVLTKNKDTLFDDLRQVFIQALKEHVQFDVSDIISFTIGAYQIENNDELVQTMMDKANMAHKNAKSKGKSNALWYNDALLDKLKRENWLTNYMHKSMEEGDFKLYLQPKCDMKSQRIIGAEALVRWELPEGRKTYPDDFIPLFEKNGYIVELDFYMLHKVCEHIRKYLDQGGTELFSISVNFSRVTVYYRNFYTAFLEIVDHFQIPHEFIEIEITESAFNEIADFVIQELLKLHQQGFRISMDDFGAGYSCLNLLDKLPIQIIKLDREFLRESSKTQKVKGIISGVVDLAHTLGMKVVCEGIEQEEHVQFLKQTGCDFGQGYYIARPMEEAVFAEKYEVR